MALKSVPRPSDEDRVNPGLASVRGGHADALYEWAFGNVPRGAVFVAVGEADFGRIVAANDGAGSALGHPAAALLGRNLLEYVPVASRAGERERLKRVAEGELSEWELECRIPRLDTSAWIHMETSVVRDDEGRTHCLLTWVDDVTQRRLSAQKAEVSAIAASIATQAASVDGAISALLPAVAGRLALDFAAVWKVDPDGIRLSCDSLWQSVDVPGRALANVTRTVQLVDEGTVGAAFKTGTPRVTTDMAREACPRATAAASDGLRSAVALPVLLGSHIALVFEFASRADDVSDPLTVETLQDLSAQLGPLLTRKRTEERRAPGRELLLVEDNPFIARLVREMLETSSNKLRLLHVETLAAARQRLLSSPPACLLLDLTLPDADGLHALIEARRAAPEVPIVVLTGLEDEGLAVRAVREGAQDYLMKRKVDMHSLSRAIRYAMERKGAEQEHLEQRLRDPLTQLPNRILFLDRLRVALMRSAGAHVGVLLVNLDRFRLINDSLGPDSGDQLLSEAASRLGRVLRTGTTLASFGGDEFAVLLESADEASALALAERLRGALLEPFAVGGRRVTLTATIGIALDRGDDGDAERLLREADTALSRGKEMGGGREEMFAEEVRERLRCRLNLETGLREALENDELVAYFQPVVALDTRAPVAMEALARWQHPTRGLIGPGDFMEVAESSGIVIPLGRQILDQAVAQLARWHAVMPAHRSLSVNVNLSARQLADPTLLDTVSDAIARHGIPARSLCLELTETALLEDFDGSLAMMRALKDLGITLALDDFGTGYSSLSYLHRLPFDKIKLDRSFVSAMRAEGTSSIVAAVAQMADALGLPAVAEGVESDEDVERLLFFGYQFGQGYRFARPLTAAHATALLTPSARSDTVGE